MPHQMWPLPRVCFEYRPQRLPINIVRHQIPLLLAWASTVHRVQSDDLHRVGADLQDQFFTHGQLVVAGSRGHTRDEAKYLVIGELWLEFDRTADASVQARHHPSLRSAANGMNADLAAASSRLTVIPRTIQRIDGGSQ